MSDRERTVKRIEKFLALASSDNEHEAAVALAQAQRLMERHAIAESDLGRGRSERPHTDHEPLDTYSTENGGLEEAVWRRGLARVLADATGCYAYELVRMPRVCIALAGRTSDVEVCRTLYHWCANEIERIVRERVYEFARDRGSTDRIDDRDRSSIDRGLDLIIKTTRYRRGLYCGAVIRIQDEVSRERESTRREMQDQVSQSALMVIDTRAREAEQAIGELRESESRTPDLDARATREGYDAAEDIYARARRRPVESGS